MPNIIDVITSFGKFSGLKLNIDKNIGLWIGRSKTNTTRTICQLQMKNTHVKALGIYFGNNKEECDKLNWCTKLETVSNKCME